MATPGAVTDPRGNLRRLRDVLGMKGWNTSQNLEEHAGMRIYWTGALCVAMAMAWAASAFAAADPEDAAPPPAGKTAAPAASPAVAPARCKPDGGASSPHPRCRTPTVRIIAGVKSLLNGNPNPGGAKTFSLESGSLPCVPDWSRSNRMRSTQLRLRTHPAERRTGNPTPGSFSSFPTFGPLTSMEPWA